MDRRDEMSMYEPERIDSLAKLSDDANQHYQLHQRLVESASFRNQHHPKLSSDFNDRLLAALNNVQQTKGDEHVSFASHRFFSSRSLLGIAAIALFSVGLGIVGFSYLNYTEPKTVKYQSPPAIESQEFDHAKFNESPTIKREIPLPTPTQKSKPESNEKLSASNQADNEWVDESTIANPEAQLLDQISAETNTEIRKSLQQKLLKLYESTGQTEKANRLRRNIKD